VLTSGALGMNPWSFFGTLAAFRMLRFGFEAALACRYGRHVLRWMRTPVFEAVVGVFIGLALIGTVISAVALIRGSKRASEASASSVSERPPVKS
jgi:hypothetical protein